MRLTDRVVRGLPAPPQGNRVSYDGTLGGFGIRTTAAGSKSFVLNYRRRSDGVERRYTIGSWPAWSVASAREEAARLKRLVDSDGDPVGEHQAERVAPTVADLTARFLEEHVSKLRPHTRRDYESMLRNDILPALAKMKVSAVEFEHIERLHAKITKRGAAVRANRTLQVASRMFTLAVKWKLRPDNPAKGIEQNREHLRKRYLKQDELAQLTKALAEDSNQQASDVFRLLLLTGARKNEVLSATWEQFDLAAGVWVKPHTMTKQQAEHHIPLSAPARQLLSRLREHSGGSPWVFPGRQGRPREDLKYSWERICKAAKITGLRVHDLRHSHASYLVSAGFSLPVIARLLGHSHVETSARYSHLFDDPLREATERVGAIISGTQSAEIVPLERRGGGDDQTAEQIPELREFVWLPMSGKAPVPLGKVIHVTREMMANDTVDMHMAFIERLFATQGPAPVAHFLAERLRDCPSHPGNLDLVARMLDPSEGGYLKLVLVRRRKGKTATRHVNDAAIAKAVKIKMEARGNKHGDQRKAVAEVVKLFNVKKATVLKAMRSK
jgi:integrase